MRRLAGDREPELSRWLLTSACGPVAKANARKYEIPEHQDVTIMRPSQAPAALCIIVIELLALFGVP